ncbi:MAG TPA: hypothetical protein PKL85_10940 [Bacteroidia bacterium]|nr:hypothetical protein [Bacteroidia bacterium]
METIFICKVSTKFSELFYETMPVFRVSITNFTQAAKKRIELKESTV